MVDRARIVPFLVACTIGMEMIDSTVISTALPAIAKDFGVAPLTLSIAVTTYMLSLAIFIPISGWVADKFGARRVFQVAILVFLVGSIACALSHTLPDFVAARALQGLGGSMMTPVGRLVLVRTVPKERMVDAMALVAMPALVGPLIGPPLGGFIVTHFTWRWIFLINVPLGVVGLVLGALLIPRDEKSVADRFDSLGFMLTAVGFSMVMFGLETAGRGFLPAYVSVVLVGGGALFLGLYLRHARRTEHPVLDLALIAIPTFRKTVLGGFLSRVGIGSLAVLAPLMLQIAYGFSPLEAGIIAVSAALGAMGAKPAVPHIIRTWGFRKTLVRFSFITGLSIVPLGLTRPDLVPLATVVVLVATGVTRSVLFTTMQTLTYADVPPPQMSQATSFASMIQQLSLATGVAVGSLIVHILSRMGFEHAGHAAPAAFAIAFVIIGMMSASSVFSFASLPANAGASYVPKRRGRASRHAPAASTAALEGTVQETVQESPDDDGPDADEHEAAPHRRHA